MVMILVTLQLTKGEKLVSKQKSFTGTWTMLRFMLRRDRIQLPIWIVSITFAVVMTLVSFAELYPNAAERQATAMMMTNPASVAMTGPNFYLEDYTLGAMMSHQMLGMTGIVVALMSIFLIVRHTRKEEETGRAELVRASVVGRHANMTAALLLAVGANLILAVIVAVSMGSFQFESVTWEGSFLFGIGLATIGLSFSAVSVLLAQFFEHARSVSGVSTGLVVFTYTLRAIGDIQEGFLSWLSPIGWAQQTSAFVDDNWMPLILSVLFMFVIIAIAYPLSTKRDVGSGMIQPRRGKASASPLLTNPIGLAFRLQRTNIIIWSFALLLFGMAYGSFLGEAEEMMASVGESMETFFPDLNSGMLADTFAAMFMSVSAMVASIPSLQSILKLRSEEKNGRIEVLLSSVISRSRLLGSYVFVSLVNTILFLFMAGFGMGITGSQSMNDSSYLLDLTIAGLAFAPAIWIGIGLVVLLFGSAPRKTSYSWAIVIYAFIVVYLGEILQMPDWMMDISPFNHIPKIPAENFDWLSSASLTALAAILIIIGWISFRRRDLDV